MRELSRNMLSMKDIISVKRSGPTEAKGAEIIGAFGILVMVAVVGKVSCCYMLHCHL